MGNSDNQMGDDLIVKSKTDIVKYILNQKTKGKTKDEIFNDLVDNHKVNKVFARVTVESIRWAEQ